MLFYMTSLPRCAKIAHKSVNFHRIILKIYSARVYDSMNMCVKLQASAVSRLTSIGGVGEGGGGVGVRKSLINQSIFIGSFCYRPLQSVDFAERQ